MSTVPAVVKLAQNAAGALRTCEIDELTHYIAGGKLNCAANGVAVAHMNEAIKFAAAAGIDVCGNKPTSCTTITDARVTMIQELLECRRLCKLAADRIAAIDAACEAACAVIGNTRTKPTIVDGSTINFVVKNYKDNSVIPVFTWDAKKCEYVNSIGTLYHDCGDINGREGFRLLGRDYHVNYDNNGIVKYVTVVEDDGVISDVKWSHINRNTWSVDEQKNIFGRKLAK